MTSARCIYLTLWSLWIFRALHVTRPIRHAGDGMVDGIMAARFRRDATLGIISTGTPNNVAFNLGITGDITKSVARLRRGRRWLVEADLIRYNFRR